MSPLVETTFFVFGLIAAGYIAGLTGYLSAQAGDALTEFAVGVALPLLLFRTMIAADFHGAAPWALWASYFTAVIVAWSAGHLLTTRVFGRDGRTGVVGGVTSSFSNLVILGIPFMLGVYGQQGFEILSLLVSVHLPVMLAASILLHQWAGRDDSRNAGWTGAVRDFLSSLFRNPLVLGILGGLLWRLAGLPMPTVASRLIDALADIAGPISLFAVGLVLRRFGLARNIPAGVTLAGVKLMLMPAAALGMALALGLPPLSAKVAVAAASLPAGANSWLIATQFGTGQALASNAMTIGTAAAVLTTVFWLAVAQAVFG
jgi:malonate transporter and related proteins